MSVERYHHEQRFSNSCLAACITITRIRTGKLRPDEAEQHEIDICERLGAHSSGILVPAAAKELGSAEIVADPDQPNNYLVLQGDLISGRWWHIAIVSSPELARYHEELGLAAASRHGALSPPLGPPHAVVLVGSRADGLRYLDPWFPSALQPQQMTVEGFARMWTGIFIPVRIS